MKRILKIAPLTFLIFFSAFLQVHGQEIVINEMMADNETMVEDQDGEYSDWIELFNNSSFTIDLLDYSLSDDAGELNKWKFPAISIPPHGFLTVFASGKNQLNPNELHTNFKISSSGEPLFLSHSSGQIIDQVAPVELAEDQSYGRVPDGANNFLTVVYPSFNSSNNENNQLIFSFKSGFYPNPFFQKINSLTSDPIYYTLDGSVPTENSNTFPDSLMMDYRYTAPNIFSEIPTTPDGSLLSYKGWESPDYLIDKANILRCASYKNGVRTSAIYTHTYFIDSTIVDKYQMPIISLVTEAENLFDPDHGIYVPGVHLDSGNPEWTGNYFERGELWEKPVHIEYFEADGNLGFSQDAGVQIHGGKTRHAAQKSLRLSAKNIYGKKYFSYPLMPQRSHSQYKSFLLKTTMGSWDDVIITDVLAHEMAKNLNSNFQDHRPVVVFINGEYWGIQTIQDRIDERYIAYSYGLDKDSVEFRGYTNQEYFGLRNFIEDNDLSENSNYEYVKTKIEVENFIDYYIAQMFIKNYDWPANNIKLWKEKNPNGKWRWVFYDIDAGFGNYGYNMFEHVAEDDPNVDWPNSASSTFMYRNLIKNEAFRNQFISRYVEIMNNEFRRDYLMEKLNDVVARYEPELPDHIARWNYPESYEFWENRIEEKIVKFFENRHCVVEKNMANFFKLPNFEFSCFVNNPPTSEHRFLLIANPNDGNFFVYSNAAEELTADIIITDLLGRTVYTEQDVLFAPVDIKYFQLTDLLSNTYFFAVENEDFREVMKFVLIR